MSTPPPPRASLIGASLGPYAVEQLIGCGAVGAVYAAFDATLSRRVALKVLLGTPARNPELVQRFRQEALSIAPLRHPNIVRIYEAGIREGTPFIAMELIEGEPLESLLNRHGKLPWMHALHISRQVADALGCAHHHGLIHRDVKPANILIDGAGRVRLTDFGLAQGLGSTMGRGSFSGTVSYMAPEQCRGESPQPASDLFALGVLLYRMLTGSLPFEGSEPEAVISAVLHQEPRQPRKMAPEVPDDVSRLVMHLLQKDAVRRPTSARELSKDLIRLQREKGGVSAMPEALDAYIREQARVRMLPGRRAPSGTNARAGRTVKWFWVAAAALVISCGFLAGSVAGGANGVGTVELTGDATVGMEVQAVQDGISRLSLGVGSCRLEGVAWSADARRLLVTRTGANSTAEAGRSQILEVDQANQTARALYEQRLPVLLGRGTLAVRNSTGDIELAALEDAEAVLLRPLGRIRTTERVLAATKAPDGNAAAYVSMDQQGRHSVHWQELPAGEPVVLLRGNAVPAPPVFSPDGASLLFFSAMDTGEICVWLYQEGNGQPIPLVVGAILPDRLCFSGDGATLAVSFSAAPAPRIELWSIAARSKAADAGTGEIGVTSWDRLLGRFAVVQRDPAPQLRLITPSGAVDWTLSLPSDAEGPAFVSADGKLAALSAGDSASLFIAQIPQRASLARLEPNHASK